MKKRILLLLIIVVQVFKLSAQNGHGLNLKYSYSDVYYPELIGGVNFIELNYLLKQERAHLNIGILKDIPYRYKIGTTIGLNVSFKYRLFKIKSSVENFVLTGFNLARNNYKFKSYGYYISNSNVYENITTIDQTKSILGVDIGTGFQYNFSPRIHIQIGAIFKSNLVNYEDIELSTDDVFYPSYFLSLNYLIKCD